jgi:hypothetical protein
MRKISLVLAVLLLAGLLSGCITYTYPESDKVTMKAGELKEFYVDVFSTAAYGFGSWYVDDDLRKDYGLNFVYSPDESDIGTHTVTFNVTWFRTTASPSWEESYTWTVTVEP